MQVKCSSPTKIEISLETRSEVLEFERLLDSAIQTPFAKLLITEIRRQSVSFEDLLKSIQRNWFLQSLDMVEKKCCIVIRHRFEVCEVVRSGETMLEALQLCVEAATEHERLKRC